MKKVLLVGVSKDMTLEQAREMELALFKRLAALTSDADVPKVIVVPHMTSAVELKLTEVN